MFCSEILTLWCQGSCARNPLDAPGRGDWPLIKSKQMVEPRRWAITKAVGRAASNFSSSMVKSLSHATKGICEPEGKTARMGATTLNLLDVCVPKISEKCSVSVPNARIAPRLQTAKALFEGHKALTTVVHQRFKAWQEMLNFSTCPCTSRLWKE